MKDQGKRSAGTRDWTRDLEMAHEISLTQEFWKDYESRALTN